MAKAMGMMSGCYFVGREELLEWINKLLDLNYTRVEDTSNGAAFCQVIDAIHPGTVALGRVNYSAIAEPEMVNNYKVLQDSFHKNGITQYIDVPTLTKGKYMAALELFQWIHGYYDQTGPHEPYDPVARRKQARCAPPNERAMRSKPKPAGMARRKDVAPLSKPTVNPSEVGHIPGRGAKVPKAVAAAERPQKKEAPAPAPARIPAKESARPAQASKVQSSAPVAAPDPGPNKEIKKLQKEIKELQDEVDQKSQERDFYFEKLRKIEDFCQDHEDEAIIGQVLEILYEADESRGFLPPEEEEDEE